MLSELFDKILHDSYESLFNCVIITEWHKIVQQTVSNTVSQPYN